MPYTRGDQRAQEQRAELQRLRAEVNCLRAQVLRLQGENRRLRARLDGTPVPAERALRSKGGYSG